MKFIIVIGLILLAGCSKKIKKEKQEKYNGDPSTVVANEIIRDRNTT